MSINGISPNKLAFGVYKVILRENDTSNESPDKFPKINELLTKANLKKEDTTSQDEFLKSQNKYMKIRETLVDEGWTVYRRYKWFTYEAPEGAFNPLIQEALVANAINNSTPSNINASPLDTYKKEEKATESLRSDIWRC